MENLKNVAPIEDFNWDAYENGETVTNVSHEDLEKAYDNTLNKVNDREVVDGTVIAMNKREVVVNIGYKSDGIIPLNEFRYNPDLKVGDTVEVYIENQEDKKGQLVLSHRKARATRSWDRVNAALENEEIIKGYIKCRTKGGMIVDVFGIEAFLPGSQIDVKPIRDYDVFVGKTMEFKVVKINQEFKNVVVSHKALIEAELEQQKKEIIGKLEKGQVLEGTVKNITSYGVFIDLGGVDGLIHITDLSWGRVSDPKEVVELDQKLNVVILDSQKRLIAPKMVSKKRPSLASHKRKGAVKLYSAREELRSAVLSEVLNGTDHLRGVGVLVVVPGHDLNLIGVVVDLSDHGLGSVEQRAVTHADDVGRNDLILVVAEGLRSSSLHGSVDGLLGDVLALDNGNQDGGGAGGDGNALSRADQLAVQLGDDQADGLGSAGGVRNGVDCGGTVVASLGKRGPSRIIWVPV